MSQTTVKQTTELCRYCLMCRHVCPVAHLTRLEATSPHGWGILVASVERGVATWNDDTVNVLYQCTDCGLCQAHCATDQPLPLAINASRADVVTQKLAPVVVYNIQEKLSQWQNPYSHSRPETVTEQGEAALVVGAAGHHLQPKTVAAALQLLEHAGVNAVPIALGRESAYLANTLGLVDEARLLGQATLTEISQVGAQRVFLLTPGDVYTFNTIFAHVGLTWPESVETIEVTTFLAAQLEAGQIAFNPRGLQNYTFYDPDQTVRVPKRWTAPRKLLAALTDTPPIELFWRKERAAPCGTSGGLQFTQPNLATQLAQARLSEAQERGVKTIITDDPAVLNHLTNQVEQGQYDLEVIGLFELLAQQLS